MFFVPSFKGLVVVALTTMAFAACPASSRSLAKNGEPTHLTRSSRDKRADTMQRVRGQALALLQNENGCSAWFHEADDDPAGVFQSLQFKIEKEKQAFVLRVMDVHGGARYKHPWAARSWQWGGRNSTVILNPSGPFFNPILPVIDLGAGGAVVRYSGFRMLTIGPYKGDTTEAQITTLLHELGHVTARIPEDGDTWDGKSSENTEEILRHCKTEIQEFAKLNLSNY